MPDIYHGSRERTSVGIGHSSSDIHVPTLKVAADVFAQLEFWRSGVERPEHRCFSCPRQHPMVDRVHQHRYAKRVGQEDELLPRIGAQPAGFREEADSPLPFRLGRLDLADEGMKMLDQRPFNARDSLWPASRAAGRLYAGACGSITAWVSACGKPKVPPSVWQIL